MFRKMSKQILRSYMDTIFDVPQPLHSHYIVWLGLDRSQKNDYPPYNSQKEDWNDFRVFSSPKNWLFWDDGGQFPSPQSGAPMNGTSVDTHTLS